MLNRSKSQIIIQTIFIVLIYNFLFFVNALSSQAVSSTSQSNNFRNNEEGVSSVENKSKLAEKYKNIIKEKVNEMVPKILSNDKKENNKEANKKDAKENENKAPSNFIFKAQVALGDGRTVAGTIKLRAHSKIRIKHFKEGIEYYKNIYLKDIEVIKIKGWRARHVKRREKGEVYRFSVARYLIQLRDGQKFLAKNSFFNFMENFILTNKFGKVRLYTYWIDLYTKKETWHTGLQGSPKKEWALGHFDVVKEITFIKNTKE